VKLYPGVLPLLDDLRAAGWKLAVATASRNAGAVLRAVNLQDAFDVIVSPADVPYPAATKTDIFRTAAARLAVAVPRVVAVEDASDGVEAAHEAGLPCVAVTTSESVEALRAAGAELIVPDPSWLTVGLLERVLAAVWARRGVAQPA
jgi:beta-phosphoglucomutase